LEVGGLMQEAMLLKQWNNSGTKRVSHGSLYLEMDTQTIFNQEKS